MFVLICPWIRRGFLSWKHSFCLPGMVTEIQNRNEVDNPTREDHILNTRGEQNDYGKGIQQNTVILAGKALKNCLYIK